MNFRSLVLWLVSAALFTACQSEEVIGPASLKSLVDKVELAVDGETKTFVIKATRDWTAKVTPEDSGFEVYPLSGKASNEPQTITVTAGKNTGRIRSAVITFTSGGLNPLKVSLSQNGELGDKFSVAEIRKCSIGDNLPLGKLKVVLLSDYSFGNVSYNNLYVQDNTAGIQLRLNSEHQFAKGDSLEVDLDGAVLSEYGQMLQIEVQNAGVRKYAEGDIVAKTVTVEDFLDSKYESQYISIPDVQVVAADLEKNFVMEGMSTEIGVESKTEASKPGRTFYIYSYCKSGEDKVLSTTAVPQGSGVLSGIASRYNDKFQIVLTSTEDFASMTGDRFAPAPFVKIKKYSYSVGEAAGFIKVAVESNTAWTVSENADWLEVSEIPEEGGNGEFKLSYAALPNLNETREAEVTVQCPNGRHTFTVTQKVVEVTSIVDFNSDATDAGERYRLSGTISEWYTTTSILEEQSKREGYFRIVDDNGNNALIYGCKVSADSETNDFGTLGLVIGDKVTLEGEKSTFPNVRAVQSYLVSYEVAPPFVQVDECQVTARGSATFVKIPIKSNTTWTVTTQSDWIKTYTQNGNGIGDIEVTFDKNPSMESERVAILTIAAEGVDNVVVTLTQTRKEELQEDEKSDLIDEKTSGVVSLANGYKAWTMQTAAAAYAGNTNGGRAYIQMRSTDASGIVSTVSGGKVRKVELTFTAEDVQNNTVNRAVDVYVSNTAYTGPSDLYDDSKKGVKITSFKYVSNSTLAYSFEIPGDYEYVGLRSYSGAIYLDNIQITWE